MMQITSVEVKEEVRLARTAAHYRDDKNLSEALKAQVGSPVLVHHPTGEPAFWLVPLIVEDRACGYSTVDMQGNVQRLGIFGANERDRAAWLPAAFFKAPPERAMQEIRLRYGDAEIFSPIFSYDISPLKWGWMLHVKPKSGPERMVFITPGGWYERKPEAQRAGYEG